MRKRYFGKLLSIALSATLALTSVVPAHAAGFDADEDDGVIVVDEEEAATEFDDIDDEYVEVVDEEDGEAEFNATPNTITIHFSDEEASDLADQSYEIPSGSSNSDVAVELTHSVAGKTGCDGEWTVGTTGYSIDGDGKLAITGATLDAAYESGQEVTVTASYTEREYTFTYEPHYYDVDGSTELTGDDVPSAPTFADETYHTSTEVVYSSANAIFSNHPNIEGYTFDKYYVSSSGSSGSVTLSTQITQAWIATNASGALTVYPKYVKKAPLGANATYLVVGDGYYTGTDGTSAGGAASAKDANTAEFVYGTVYTKGQNGSGENTNSKYVFTAHDDDDGDGGDDGVDADVEWSIWKFKAIDDGAATPTQLSDADLLDDDNLEDASGDFAEYGLYAQAQTDGTFEIGVISGKYAKKAMNVSGITASSAFASGENYVLKVVDKSATPARKAKKFPITVKVDEATIKLDNTAIGSASVSAFTNAKMGYEVLEASSTVTVDTEHIKAKQLTLSATGILPSYSISDLDFTITGVDADKFEVSLVGDGAMAGDLFTNNDVKIRVAPKSGLSSVDDKAGYRKDGTTAVAAGDGTYEAILNIKTNALYKPAQFDLSFAVSNNIAFSKIVAHGGKEVKTQTIASAQVTPANGTDVSVGYYTDSACNTAATGTANGSTSYYVKGYDLGTLKKGEDFNDILITANGGNYAITFAQTDEGFTGKGIVGSANEASGSSSYNVHGKIKGTVPLGVHTFILQAKDGDGGTGKETAKTMFFYTVAEYDAVVTIDGEAAPATYSWYVPSDYAVLDAKREIKIKNKSDEMLTLTVKKSTGTPANFAIDSEEYATLTKTISIAAGGEGIVAITPKATLSAAIYSTNLVITDGNTYSKTIGLSFEVKGGDANITKPSADGSITPTTADEWEVGKEVNYQLELTKVAGVDSVVWSIDAVNNSPGAYTDTADTLKTFGLELTKDGVITGVPKKAGTLKIQVKANYKKNGTDGEPQYRKIEIKTKLAESGFKFTAGGKEINDTTKAFEYGEIKKDSLESFAVEVNVTNNTALDMISDPTDTTNHYGNVKLEILNVDGATTDNGKFELVLDSDNSALNSDLLSNGFDLEAGISQPFVIKYKKGAAALSVAEHYIIVQAWHRTAANASASESAAATYTKICKFKITFDVKDAPSIDKSKVTGFVSGKQIKSSDDKKYVITSGSTYAGSAFTYAWTDGEVPGLELSEDGVITGTPERAGKFTVTVTATKKNDSKVTGILTHDIEVAGAAELVLKTNLKSGTSDADTQIASTDKVNILLPGMIVGDTVGEKQVFTIAAATGAAKKDAENVTITVTDAADNRTNAADIRKSPANPYEGSSNFIGVDTASWTTLEKGTIQKFRIVSKGQPTAGVYKVKIVISADNATEITFYAIMVVTEKLVITQPDDISTSIGKEFGATGAPGKDVGKTSKNIIVSATGGSVDQKIKWSEVGTKVTEGTTEKTKFYVTKGTKGEAHNINVNDDTGLGLAIEGETIGYEAPTGIDNTGGTKNEIFGQMKAAGTYTVNLKAEVDAVDYTTAGTKTKAIVDLSTADSWTIEAATATKMIPKQTAEAVTFTITSAKTDKVVISQVADTAADTATTRGTVNGLKNGTTMVTRTGYTYNPVATYDKTLYTTKVTIENKSGIALGKMKAEFAKGDYFEISAGGSATSIIRGGTETITFRPVSNLTKGEYTDTLMITGDDFETVEFTVKFTVADATYLATVDEPDPDDSSKRITYVEDNVRTDKVVELASFVAGKPATGKELTIKNTGNTALSRISVYEVDSTGKKYDDGADTMLTFTSPGTSLAPNSTPTGFTVTPKKTVTGTYNSYINIHFTEGSAESAAKKDIIIPVTYTVYSDDVSECSVTPAEKTTLSVAEGYGKTDAAVTFKVTNTSSDSTDVISKMKLASYNSTDFEIVDNTAVDIKPGENAEFTIRLKAGKSAGKYTTDVTFGDGSTNIKTKAKRSIEVTVTESSTYTVKAISAETTATTGFTKVTDERFATALYNSVVRGGLYATGTYAPGAITTGVKTVHVDVDKDGKADITLKFTLVTAAGVAASTETSSAPSTDAVKATDVTATIHADNSVKYPSVALTLTSAQAKLAAAGLGYKAKTTTTEEVLAKYFTTVNFNFYALVEFTATDFVEKTAVLTKDNKDVVVDTTAADGHAQTLITAVVPYRSTIASVFNDGVLPSAKQTNRVMLNWVAGSTPISVNTVVTRDYTSVKTPQLTPEWHVHSYPPVTETDEKYVKCVWTKDADGNRTAVLHLHCDDPDCPDYEGSEIVVDGTKPTTIGTLIYQDREAIEATCDKPAGYKYSVKVRVLDAATGETNASGYKEYTCVDPDTDGDGESIGHKIDLTKAPTIVWTDANKDGKITADEVKITRVCERDSEHILTLEIVSVERDAESSKAPTCTEAGYDMFAITYKDVDELGKPVETETKVVYDKKFVVAATGHSEELEVIVEEFDAEANTGKLTLKCQRETCSAEDHIVFGPQVVTFSKSADGTYSYTATLTDGTVYNVTYEDELFELSNVDWDWKVSDAGAFETATATFTSKTGKTKTVKVTASDTDTTAAKYVTSQAYDEYKAFTVYASFQSKGSTVSATETRYFDATGKEVQPHDHKWAQDGDIVWSAADAENNRTATLTVTCKVDENKPHSESATITVPGVVKGLITTWTAEFDFNGVKVTDTYKVQNSKPDEEMDSTPIGDTIEILGLAEEYKFTGAAIQPKITVMDMERGEFLAKGVDYTVSYKNNKKVGSVAEVIVKGKGNYAGQGATATFKIVDPMKDITAEDAQDLKGAKITAISPANFTYTGEAQYPTSITLQFKDKSTATYEGSPESGYTTSTEGKGEIAVSISNNTNKGTATLLITGKVGTNGKATTLKKTFKIAAVDMSANAKDFEIKLDDETVAWASKGAKPAVEVYWKGDLLIQGEDYTVAYKNSNKVGKDTAQVIVTGKNNFAKKLAAKTFSVEAFDLATADAIAATTAADGVSAKSVKVTILDSNGDVIPAGKLAVSVLDENDAVYTGKLVAGKTYKVKAVKKSEKVTEVTGEATKDVTVGINLAKASIKVAKGFAKTYTGEPIELTDEEIEKNITVTVNKKVLKYGEDFTVGAYANNIKKGSMKITLVGNESAETPVSGNKVVSVKISAKPLK